ncbi:MAG: phage tail tape measure protein [Pseudomonadota bacterium]
MPSNLNIKMQVLAEDDQVIKTLDHLITTLKKIEGAGGTVGNSFQQASGGLNALTLEEKRLNNETLNLKKQLQESRTAATQYRKEIEELRKGTAESRQETARQRQEYHETRKASLELKNALTQLKLEQAQARKAEQERRKELQQLRQETQNAQKSTQEFKNVLNGLASIVSFAVIASAFMKVTQSAAAFETQINSIKAVTGATAQEIANLRQQALDLGASTVFTATQTAEAMTNLGKAGFSAVEITKAMPGVLNMAAASGADLGTAAEIAAGALRGFGLDASKSTHVADLLASAANKSAVDITDLGLSLKYIAPVAQASGQSIEETTALLMALGDRMVKGEQAGTSMRQMLLRLQDPPREAKNVLNQLGISISDTHGKMLPLTQILEQFREKTKDLTMASRNQAASMLAGIDASSAFLALVNTAPEKLDAYNDAQKRVDGMSQKMADTMRQGLSKAFDEAKGSVETLSITLGSSLEPATVSALGGITNLTNGTTELIKTINPELTDAIADLSGSFASLFAGLNIGWKDVKQLKDDLQSVSLGASAAAALINQQKLNAIDLNTTLLKLFGMGNSGYAKQDQMAKKETQNALKGNLVDFLSSFYSKDIEKYFKKNGEMSPEMQLENVRQGLIMPVQGKITQTAAQHAARNVPAIDIQSKYGSPVVAPGSGQVLFSGYGGAKAGNMVTIQLSKDLIVSVKHLRDIAKEITKGTIIKQGDFLGGSGTSGNAQAMPGTSITHIDAKFKGKYVDPQKFMPFIGELYGNKNIDFSKIGKDKKPRDYQIDDSALRDAFYNEELKRQKSLAKVALPELALKDLSPGLDENFLKKSGFSADTIKNDFGKLFENIGELGKDYKQFLDDSNFKAKELQDKYIEDFAKLRAEKATDLYKIDQSKAPEAEKKTAKDAKEKEFALKEAALEAERLKDYQKFLTEKAQKAQDFYDKEYKLAKDSVEKQAELLRQFQAESQKIALDTRKIQTETENRKAVSEARLSKDPMLMISAEYQAKTNDLNNQITMIRARTAEELAAIDLKIEKEAKFDENVQAGLQKKAELEKNATAQINALKQEHHENELDRIEKETQARQEQFDKSLSWLEKLLNMAGKFAGKDSWMSKIASYFSEYKGILSGIFGFFNQKSAQAQKQSAGIAGVIQDTTGINIQSGGGLSSLLGSTFNLSAKESKNISSGLQGLADFGKAWTKAWNTSTTKSGGISKGISGLRSYLGLGQAKPVMGSIAGALSGGLTGYEMGQDSGALGMLGGALTGASTGFMFGGGLGALIGGGVGLIGGLLGWLFGSRTRKEMKRLQFVSSQAQAGVTNASAQINSAQSMAQRAKLMNELYEVKSRADNAMSAVLQQESYMLTELDPSKFKSKKARREAAQAQSDMAQKVFEQKMAAEELQRQVQEAIRQRQAAIEEEERGLYSESFSLYGQSFADPLRNNAELALSRQMESNNKYTAIVRDFADSPTALNLAKENRLREMKILQRQGELETVDTGAKEIQFYSEATQEHLKATDAGSVASLQEEKRAALDQLRFDQQKLMIEYADNQTAMTTIAKLETDKRKNIEADYQEEIRDELQKTAQTIADLLSKRDEIAGQFDFKRAKSRTDIIKDQLKDVDKSIREQWPESIANLQNLTPDTLKGMSADQLETIKESVQTVSNFTNSKAFNNVINLNVNGNTSEELITNIKNVVQNVLNNNARYVNA